MASWAGNDPAITCLRGRALDHSCSTTKTKLNGVADGTRTRMNSVDSGAPYLSASTAQMGVRESTHLLLHHPIFRFGAPTNLRTRQSAAYPAINSGSHNGYRVQPGRPAGIRTRIASFGEMCPVQLSDRPKMVRAEGLDPSRDRKS